MAEPRKEYRARIWVKLTDDLLPSPALSAEEGARENPAFFHSHGDLGSRSGRDSSGTDTAAPEGRPHVTVKLAMSLDGRINEPGGSRTAISGPPANAWVHQLRAGFDAILVGGETARIDDPLLTVRGDREPIRAPMRVLLDRKAALPAAARVFNEGEAPVVVFVSRQAREADMERLEALGAAVHPVAERSGALDLVEVLRVLGELGARSVLCEGGGRLAGSLIDGGMVGRIHLLMAPQLIGPEGVPALAGTPDLSGFEPSHTPLLLGRDVLLSYDRVPA